MSTYQIIDEPKGSRFSNMTSKPMWPLLAFMLGGALSSWVWSALNSLALNSPSRNKELAIVGVAFITYFAMYISVGVLIANGALEGVNAGYIKVGIVAIELIFCYKLFLMQSNSFDVHEYFNGKVANPAIGLIISVLVGRKIEAVVISALLAGGN